MKKIFVVISVLFAYSSILGQTGKLNEKYTADDVIYPQIKYFLLAEKKDPEAFRIHIKTIWISKIIGSTMEENDPVVPAFYIGKNMDLFTLSKNELQNKKRYSINYPKINGILQLAGMATGILAGIFYPSYIGSIYHNSGATINAYNTYIQSTYHQHE